MKELTPQQEKFAQLIVSGVNQSDAYRGAYSAGKMSAKSINEEASRMMAHPDVASRVASLRKPIVEAVRIEARMTLESHIAEMDRIKKLAEAKEDYSVALKAEHLRGQAVGLYVAKTEDVTDPVKKAMGRMKPEEAQAALEALKQVKAIREKAKSAT
jgi:phage terminase small subunit